MSKYIQEKGLAGKQFESLAAHNLHLAHWEATVTDRRIHGTTRQQMGAYFLQAEKSALLRCPPACFRALTKRRAKSTGTVTPQ